MSGIYGWRCACGVDTEVSRERLDQESAAACYACHLLYEEGGAACTRCGAALTCLDSAGNFVEGANAASAERYFVERFLDDAMSSLHWERNHPKPPFPTDAMPAPPGWSRSTAQTRAYDAWLSDMFRTWPARKAEALADAALVAEAKRAIEKRVADAVAVTVYGDRKYRCPKCDAFALTYRGIPFPR